MQPKSFSNLRGAELFRNRQVTSSTLVVGSILSITCDQFTATCCTTGPEQGQAPEEMRGWLNTFADPFCAALPSEERGELQHCSSPHFAMRTGVGQRIILAFALLLSNPEVIRQRLSGGFSKPISRLAWHSVDGSKLAAGEAPQALRVSCTRSSSPKSVRLQSVRQKLRGLYFVRLRPAEPS